MKIYISHSSNFDYQNKLYKPIKKSSIYQLHEVILPHEKLKISLCTKILIKRMNLMIAEVSYPSTGQGIELGWADEGGIPIICIYIKGTKLSTSLKFICKKFFEYTDFQDLVEKLVKMII